MFITMINSFLLIIYFNNFRKHPVTLAVMTFSHDTAHLKPAKFKMEVV